jgi:plasmid stabilization system protein ParE
MIIRFLEPARIELDDAISWYDSEQENLGRLFFEEVRFALKRITTFPESCAQIAPGLRRCLTRRFPYMLVYGIDNETVVIVAVAHLHREPMYWRDR